MTKATRMTLIVGVLAGCEVDTTTDPTDEVTATVESAEGTAEPCPPSSTHQAGISRWWQTYAGNAVTMCLGLDSDNQVVAAVQIVNFKAGAKMRVLSEPAAGQPTGSLYTAFNKRTAFNWYDWTKSHVTTPMWGQLFSVTNGTFFRCDPLDPLEPVNKFDCVLAPFGTTTLSFPQKMENTITSPGADPEPYVGEAGELSGKRLFALSDPRSPGPQAPYIDTYDDPGQSTLATATAEFASFFDATVGFHPTYRNKTERDRRTYVGTRNTAGQWTDIHDRAYLLTSAKGLTRPEAGAILVEDFRAMYTMQLDSGGSTQFYACTNGCVGEVAYQHYFRSSEWWRCDLLLECGRSVPEVLAVYDADPDALPVADLSPTTITYAPTAIAPGTVVTFDSGVRNSGTVATGNFNVKWFINGVQVGYGGHSGVAANTTVLNGNSALSWTATAGTHTIRFAVDVDGHVLESNETNNSTSITLTVPQADLTPTAITYNSASLVRGASVLFDSGVRNAGTADTGGFNIKWFVDGVQVGYGGHSGVAANTTVLNGNSALSWTATAGTHTIRFAIDVDGHVQESNEANNSITVTVTVP